MNTNIFFSRHQVFSLDQALEALAPKGGRSGALERLHYHVKTGRLKRISRGIYAVVPPGVSNDGFQPDPYMSAVAVRSDGIFSHHSALTLLGAAHSVWNRYTLYTERRRQPLRLNGAEIRFLNHPGPLDSGSHRSLGTRQVEYRGKLVKATGPERTLVEGFRQPDRVGGLAELIESASGFAVLDLALLDDILECYGTAKLWAATGWFLEQFRDSFHVNDAFLDRIARNRPRAPQYLVRSSRGGMLVSRWNLLLPEPVVQLGDLDGRQS